MFGGQVHSARADRQEVTAAMLPILRGQLSAQNRVIGHWSDSAEVLRFVNSADASALANLGTSCPDHFIRTKIQPLFVPWDPSTDVALIRSLFEESLAEYRATYSAYYRKHALPDSPPIRDVAPTVVLVPGLGMFSFGKSKTEARITGEFYTNAIQVMEGATAMAGAESPTVLPQAGKAAPSDAFTVFKNYVALPRSEAFRIEYWQLEEAKLRRQPPEKPFSRQVILVVGGGHGIGRAVAEAAAPEGAHIIVADRDAEAAERVARDIGSRYAKELIASAAVDVTKRDSIRAMLREVVLRFGGFDVVVNTAAMFPVGENGHFSDEQWPRTLDLNVTANYLLAEESREIFLKQGLKAVIIFTSSANAVVAKRGSEAYDVSKAALSHLVRELAVAYGPDVRVNGISPATVVQGSTMFPRDRVIASLTKYGVPFDASWTEEQLREKLSSFYAQRTITHEPIRPLDCAEAILFLASPRSRCTSGHVLPVDGGLPEAFLR